MFEQSPQKSKPKLDQATLYARGIRFEKKHDPDFDRHCSLDSSDGSHFIVPIRDQLIRLRQKLPKDAEPLFVQELENFKNSGQDSKEALRDGWSLMPPSTDPESVYYQENGFKKSPPAWIDSITEELGACEEIAKTAKVLRCGNEAEPRWMTFLQSKLFKRFDEVHDISKTDLHPLRQWEIHQDLYWNEFPTCDEDKDPDEDPLSGPKPDLTYAFPIVDRTQISSPYISDPQVKDFSLEVLGALKTNQKLCSAPTTGLKRWHTNKNLELRSSDRLCFPWAIVEAKRNKLKKKSQDSDANEELCYCQAANASAAALKLREDLVKLAGDCPTSYDGRVIFAFTCVGPTVKLWVTYKIQENTRTMMKCIWATSLELTWGVIALRMVIENMQEWVYHRVTPEIWRWIRMVRALPPPQLLIPPSGCLSFKTGRPASCEPPREGKEPTSPSSKVDAVETPWKSSLDPSRQQGGIFSLPIRSHKVRIKFGKKVSFKRRKKDFNKERKGDNEGSEEREGDERYGSASTDVPGVEEEENESRAEADSREEDEDESTAESDHSEDGTEESTAESEYSENDVESRSKSDHSENDEESTAESEYSDEEIEKRKDPQGHRSSSPRQPHKTVVKTMKKHQVKSDASNENHTEGWHKSGKDKSKENDNASPNRRRRSSHVFPSPSVWKSKFPEWRNLRPSDLETLTNFWKENEAHCGAALDVLRRFSFSWEYEEEFPMALNQLRDLSRTSACVFEELINYTLSSRIGKSKFKEELEKSLEWAVWDANTSMPPPSMYHY